MVSIPKPDFHHGLLDDPNLWLDTPNVTPRGSPSLTPVMRRADRMAGGTVTRPDDSLKSASYLM